jgi:hypothetical protein
VAVVYSVRVIGSGMEVMMFADDRWSMERFGIRWQMIACFEGRNSEQPALVYGCFKEQSSAMGFTQTSISKA